MKDLYRKGVYVKDRRVGSIFIATDEAGEMGTNLDSVLDILGSELPGAKHDLLRVVPAGLPRGTKFYLSAWGFLTDRGWAITPLSAFGTGIEHDGSFVGFTNDEGKTVAYATPSMIVSKPAPVMAG